MDPWRVIRHDIFNFSFGRIFYHYLFIWDLFIWSHKSKNKNCLFYRKRAYVRKKIQLLSYSGKPRSKQIEQRKMI